MDNNNENDRNENQPENQPEVVEYIDKKPQKYLGPSQFATVLGMCHFQKPGELKQNMEKGYRQKIYSNMAFGNKYEATALYCYRKNTGEHVVKARWLRMKENKRIGGVADGLLVVKGQQRANQEGGSPLEVVGGVEIKCHPNRIMALRDVPDYYLVQIAGYMVIYQVKFWDFMSCCLNNDGEIMDFHIIRVHWDDVQEQWEQEWYPKIKEFVDEIQWAK